MSEISGVIVNMVCIVVGDVSGSLHIVLESELSDLQGVILLDTARRGL